MSWSALNVGTARIKAYIVSLAYSLQGNVNVCQPAEEPALPLHAGKGIAGCPRPISAVCSLISVVQFLEYRA